MTATTPSSYLHASTLQRLLAVLLLILLPHAVRLPLWENVAVAAVLLWRVWAARQHKPMPGRLVRALLTFAAFGGVFGSFGRINGQHAGVALVVIMAALKLTEMDRRRDVMVMVFLLYFLCVTHFLFSQEIWTLLYLLAAAVSVTAVLIEANHAGEPLPVALTVRRAGALIAQALPLMLLMFVLFPRVPGPLWGLPSDAGAGRSGLSNRMSPGDIASLILSDEVAMRVTFDGTVPSQNQLYWRGPVFWSFDGREWSEGGPPPLMGYPVEFAGAPVGYEVALEPMRSNWLLALDAVDARVRPEGAMVTSDGRLIANAEVRERKLYRAQSYPQYRAQLDLSDYYRRLALRLPAGRNPRTVALAAQWRAEGLDDASFVRKALLYYRQEAFVYTLQPPPLGNDPVDEFLFETRRGFCEHYSSSFTVLMRAAGIPARVVTGYQGGAPSSVGRYLIVRQSDAHAWSEVWLAGQGWVRVDPTAAVAPERVEKNLASALSATESAGLNLRRNSTALLYQLEARWDWVNTQWNRWVLGYGPELQQDLLNRFGLTGWRDLMLAMIVALSLVGGLLGWLALRRAQAVRQQDAALRLWRRATGRLARLGLIQRPQEGPEDFAARVIEEQPQWADATRRLLAAYLAVRYGPAPALAELEAATRSFRRAG